MLDSKKLVEMAMDLVSDDGYLGLCIECGAEHDSIEPDACNYECEVCGAKGVFGAEQIVMEFAY